MFDCRFDSQKLAFMPPLMDHSDNLMHMCVVCVVSVSQKPALGSRAISAEMCGGVVTLSVSNSRTEAVAELLKQRALGCGVAGRMLFVCCVCTQTRWLNDG